MFRGWWNAWRRQREALQDEADAWHARHGRFARDLAGWRSMDAYLLGDLVAQERWGRIRELLEDRGDLPEIRPESDRPVQRHRSGDTPR